MATNDIFQSIGDLPPEAVRKIIDRLEFRGKDPAFVAMRETYLDRMDLGACKRVLDLGCGTGVVTRAIAARKDFTGEIVGVDFSDALIEAANRLALEEGVADRIEFRVGDSHALEDSADSYDAVVAHTLISHVTDPTTVIAQAAQAVAPGGTIAIFDGDYASLTFGAGAPGLNATMVKAILGAIVANPYVMRQIPALLGEQGLEILDFIPGVLAEAGTGSFFASMAESYTPMAIKAGTVVENVATDWLAAQQAASDAGRFFGACNFYTYLARKPGGA